MFNVPKKEQKNCQKSKIWNFADLYTTLVETLPRSMHAFLGVNLLCTLKGDVVWSFFLPYGPMFRKTKKNRKKSKMQNFEKKWSGDMVKRYLSTKLVLICWTGSGKTGFTDERTVGRRTPEWRQQLWCAVAESRAKTSHIKHSSNIQMANNSFKKSFMLI